MSRKTQVEKFQRKWGKDQFEHQILKEKELQQSLDKNKVMKDAEKILSKEVGETEEVFAVIARSGMETFIQTWNNSMENVIRETIKNEVKSMVHEEMQTAIRGMFTGMNQALGAMTQSTMPIPKEPVHIKIEEDQIEEEIKSDTYEEESVVEEVEKESVEEYQIPRTDIGRISWTTIRKDDMEREVIYQIIQRAIAHNPQAKLYSVEGIRAEKSSDLTGCYQYFHRHRQTFGATWKEFISPIIDR